MGMWWSRSVHILHSCIEETAANVPGDSCLRVCAYVSVQSHLLIRHSTQFLKYCSSYQAHSDAHHLTWHHSKHAQQAFILD